MKLCSISIAILLGLVPHATADSLNVDFNGNNWGSVIVQTQDGFEAYNARNEVSSDFVSADYSAFGTTVTVTPTWAAGAADAAKQSWWRTPNTGYPEDAANLFDLMVDWIGTDLRQTGNPLTLTLSGLPAGTYTWRSYHHDINNISEGVFNVTLHDATGTNVVGTGIQASCSEQGVSALADVTTFETTIAADGAHAVRLDFTGTGATNTFETMFLMNGFELTPSVSGGDGRAHSPSPVDGAQLTLRDVTSLSWQGSSDPHIVSIDQFDLVFGTDPDMANNTVYPNVTSPVPVEALGGLDYNARYYWRVDSHVTWDSPEVTGNLQEVVEGEPWSFTAGNGLRRPISPEQPMWLVHIDTWNYADPQKIIALIPQDIRPYVVMNISLSISHDVDTSRFQVAEYGYEVAKSWLRACAENRMWAMVQPSSGGFSQFSDFDLSVYEEFYRDYPNMIGFNYCEQFWGYDSPTDPLSAAWSDRINHFANLLELSHRYGGYLVVSWCGNQWSPPINPIGMVKRVPAFAAACRAYTENYILLEKYTQQSYQSDMESICLGAYLSGYSGQYGIRYDDTGWTDANGEHANFTMATGGAPHLEHIMLTGMTVIDGPELIWTQCFREIGAGSTSNGYTMRRWETYPQFDNVSVDIFRKLLDGTVRIPSRREVIDRTRFVIINNVNSGGGDDIYSSPETLFEGLYRMDGDGNHEYNKTFFKKTGRYPTIPTVYQLDDADAQSFQVQVNRSAYSTRWPTLSSKVTEFNSYFPDEYTGDIYAGRHENGWVVYNPYKTGQTASGSIPFQYNTCSHMELTFSQYTAGVIKEYPDRVTFYLSNYDNVLDTGLKTDTIKIYGSTAEPAYSWFDRASHQASVVTKSWSGGVFTLTVRHNGPLDITVNCAGTAIDRLTDYTPAVLVSPAKPLIYPGPVQYEGECFDYQSISGIVAGGYSQPVRNYTGQGYLRFGTNSAAAVRDSVKVPETGTYRLETRYAVTGANITTIDLYVNGVQAATPTFTQTPSLNDWAVNTQYVALSAGTNTIEFRAKASAPSSIYFDNIVLAPTVYAGNGIAVQENRTGFVDVDGAIDNTEFGYTGDGYANTNDLAGAGIDWEMNFDASITKAFTFQYACPDDRVANLYIDGQLTVRNIQLPSTGLWSNWDFVTVYAKADAGISSVRLESTTPAGLPHIDYIEVVGICALEAPTVPTGLHAAAVSTGRIDLTWDPASGATSYNVKRSLANGGPYTPIDTTTETSFSDTELSELTTYYYVISGVNSAGESDDSTQANATTPNYLPPAVPTGLVTTAANGRVTLDWDDNGESDLSSYNVYRSTTSGSYGAALVSGVTSSSYVDNTALNDTLYYYAVTAVDTATNESGYSDAATAMVTDGSNVLLSAADFEVDLGGWVNVSGVDSHDWLRDSGGTMTPNTGPDSGANGSLWYLYLETSPGGAASAGDTAILESPILGGYRRTLHFYYHMYGSQIGTLNVDVYDDAWHEGVWSLGGLQHTSGSDEYTEARVDLSGYHGPIRLRIRAVAAGGPSGDMAIDDIQVIGGLLYGDMTGDTIVNEDDLLEYTGRWLQEDRDLDLDGDGVITLFEFSVFAGNWLVQ